MTTTSDIYFVSVTIMDIMSRFAVTARSKRRMIKVGGIPGGSQGVGRWRTGHGRWRTGGGAPAYGGGARVVGDFG